MPFLSRARLGQRVSVRIGLLFAAGSHGVLGLEREALPADHGNGTEGPALCCGGCLRGGRLRQGKQRLPVRPCRRDIHAASDKATTRVRVRTSWRRGERRSNDASPRTDLVASLAGRVEANPRPQFGILLRACPKLVISGIRADPTWNANELLVDHVVDHTPGRPAEYAARAEAVAGARLSARIRVWIHAQCADDRHDEHDRHVMQVPA